MRALNGNFAAALEARTTARLDSVCLDVPGGPTLTYGELYDQAARFATALTEAGALPGDRVLVQVDKSASAVALYLACLWAGTVHVPLNPAFVLAEVEYFIHDCEPRVVVTTTSRAAAIAEMAPNSMILTVDPDGAGTLCDAANSNRPGGITERDEYALAAIIYTSGTTGFPKGAMVTHRNLRDNSEALYRVWHFTLDDILLHSLPIFHVHGLFVALHCAMLGGIPIHLLPRFDVDSVISLIPRSTVMMGVPTHYTRLMDDPRFDAELCADMRLFTSGSAPLPAASFDAFAIRTTHRICERYGMSEAGIITSNPYDGPRIAGTVGYPLPGYDVRITDRSGAPVSAGTDGRVDVKGPHLFTGYWRNEAATRTAYGRNGWFRTGDVGRLSADGRLTLEGRAGDMIISGGENIHPAEIEAILDSAAGVAESAVVGVPHPDFGQAVVAVIVVHPNTLLDRQGMARTLESKLAHFKHPKAIEVVIELPRNAMGKVQKNELRDRFRGLFLASGTT